MNAPADPSADNSPGNAPSNRTYPLALLFLVITCAAILAAAIGPLVRANSFEWFESTFELSVAILVSIIIGSTLGALVGLYHFDRRTGVLCGIAVGAIVGPVAALLLTVNATGVGVVAPAVIIGSAILLIVAWAIRPAAR